MIVSLAAEDAVRIRPSISVNFEEEILSMAKTALAGTGAALELYETQIKPMRDRFARESALNKVDPLIALRAE